MTRMSKLEAVAAKMSKDQVDFLLELAQRMAAGERISEEQALREYRQRLAARA